MIYEEWDALKSLNEISEHYDINNENWISILWNNENLVFEASNQIVRLSSSTHRSKSEIDWEMKLLNILWNTKCSVVEIILSRDGKSNIEIELSWNPTHVVVFKKAPWSIKNLEDFWDQEVYLTQEWWRSMWEIHKNTSQNFEILHSLERLKWDEEIIIANANKLLPSEEWEILDGLTLLVNEIKRLPTWPNDFGLVHTDMRPRNFHVDGSEIIHFDFDDICYHWYIYDIAVSLLHEAEAKNSTLERTQFIIDFFQNFMKWYSEANTINPEIFIHMIDFMKLRLYYAYIDYYKRLVIKWVNSWSEKMLIRKWYIQDFETFIDTEVIQKEILSLIKIN